MRMAIHYQFVACECLGIGGQMVQIPEGSWPVAERESVFILLGDRVLSVNPSAFQQLKLERKARPI